MNVSAGKRSGRIVVGWMCLSAALFGGAARPAGAESAPVSRAEFEALARRVAQLEKVLQQQQSVIQEQQKTIARQRREIERLRAAPAPAAEHPAGISSGAEIASLLEKSEFYLGATGIVQGTSGVDSRLSPEGNRTDASGSVDFEVEIPVTDSSVVHAYVEAGNGSGLDEKIPTFTGFNADADDDSNLRLSEFWYEQRWLDGRLAVKIGKIDMTATCGLRESSFDANAVANDECTQFLSPALVNNMTVPFPDYTIGAEMWFSPVEWLDIGFGAADADIDAAGASAPDWNNIGDDLFSIGELDLHTNIAGRRGNWRVYGWTHAADYPDVSGRNATHRNYGWGVSIDHELSDICTVFGRFGVQREDVAAVAMSWSAGLQLSAAPLDREDDTFGIAFVSAMLGDDWEDAARASGIDPADEYHVEAYYNWKVNSVLTLSPDLQWVGNPAGDRNNDDIWVFGLRAQLNF